MPAFGHDGRSGASSNLADLESELDGFVSLIDQDGAFDDTETSVEGRDAHVTAMAGGVKMDVSGGDPITAHELWTIFEEFVQREFDADVAARGREHGVTDQPHSLARTGAVNALHHREAGLGRLRSNGPVRSSLHVGTIVRRGLT